MVHPSKCCVVLFNQSNQSSGVQGHNFRNTEAALSNPENKPPVFFYIHFIYLAKCY